MNQLFYNIINVVFNLNIITIKSSLKTVRVNVYVTILFYHSFQRFYLNPRTNTQIHTTTVAQEGGDGWNPSPVFLICCSIWNNFTFSGKPLIFLTRLQVYFMGGGAAGGLWRHQQWSPSWLPSWILPRIRNQVKTAGNSNFCDGMILFLKIVEKTCIFTQNWLNQLYFWRHIS